MTLDTSSVANLILHNMTTWKAADNASSCRVVGDISLTFLNQVLEKDNDGRTALVHAVLLKNVTVASMLLDKFPEGQVRGTRFSGCLFTRLTVQ